MSGSTAGRVSGHMAGKANLVFGANYGEDVDPSRWVVIYPPYIDSTRKEREGRKIAKEKCVEAPNMVEIFDCVQLLGFQAALELDKAYCRDYWQRGRIRIRMFDAEKKPILADIENRRTLYAKVAALIPEHRLKATAANNKKGGGGKVGTSKPGASKPSSGKGAPAPTKKKKKGKR